VKVTGANVVSTNVFMLSDLGITNINNINKLYIFAYKNHPIITV
jgi:hypothetical protein